MSKGNLTITLSRKPVVGTVASNSLVWGTGSLNIDASRIGTGESLGGGAYSEGGRSSLPGDARQGKAAGMFVAGGGRLPGQFQQPAGRWPANLILVHLSSCVLEGSRTVPGHKGYPNGPGGKSMHYSDQESRGSDVRPNAWAGHADEDGNEAVDNWVCGETCPCRVLDEQSGDRPGSFRTSRNHQGGMLGWQAGNTPGFEDTGGASRFFKQVQSKEDSMGLPTELVEYLRTMISPPPGSKTGTAIYIPDLAKADWAAIATWNDNTVSGIVAQGEPSAEQAKELMRVLAPGGHLMLAAPEARPTGHIGACTIEDVGFEIRDAILVVREGGKVHYVPKAARSEREAGCGNLEGKDATGTVDRAVGSAGTQNPRAGAGRGAGAPRYRCQVCGLHLGGGRAVSGCPSTPDKQHVPVEYDQGPTVRNSHPTVKPVDIMVRLLDDPFIPQGGLPVLDPFLGSGTTAVACRMSGHSCIGIEREKEYLEIADARVRHWDAEHQGWVGGVGIESDVAPAPVEPEKAEAISLEDFLFGE